MMPTAATELESLKVALVHEWLVDYSGSERVVEQMLHVFPQADLYALVQFLPHELHDFIGHRDVQTSFIQRLPWARRHYRAYLPLMPLAVEQFDLSDYDLVISSNHAVAKGVITGPEQLHICMCYSPMRYAWDLTFQYLREAGLRTGVKSWLTRYLLHRLRIWDQRTAHGVDEFIAISHYIAARIQKCYRREATVIHPPVDIRYFSPGTRREDFYLTVSRCVPYKRIDLIVEAFAGMPHRKLIVIGDGPEYKRIKGAAAAHIEFLGFQSRAVVRDYMQRARAFVFAAQEDFGIVAVEAQACGTPVIAYGRGGTLETVEPGVSGLFFERQDADSLRSAVEIFEARGDGWDSQAIRAQAERFSVANFRSAFESFSRRVVAARRSPPWRARTGQLSLKRPPERTPDPVPLDTGVIRPVTPDGEA